MSDPFDLKIQKALAAALKEITPAAGYVSNLADFDPGDGVLTSRIYRGRAWFGPNDPETMVSILEGIDPSEEVAEPPIESRSGEYDWPLIVLGFVNDDPNNPTDPAYVLKADVRRRLALEMKRKAPNSNQPDPFGLGVGVRNRIVGLRIGPGVVRPADDVSPKAWFWLRLIVRRIDNAEYPYE